MSESLDPPSAMDLVSDAPPRVQERRAGPPEGCDHCAMLTNELKRCVLTPAGFGPHVRPKYAVLVSTKSWATNEPRTAEMWDIEMWDMNHPAFDQDEARVCPCRCHDAWKILNSVPVPYTQRELDEIQSIRDRVLKTQGLRVNRTHITVTDGTGVMRTYAVGWSIEPDPALDDPTWDTPERPS